MSTRTHAARRMPAFRPLPTARGRPRLFSEAAAYRLLEDASGFATMHWHGEAHGCRALVLSRLGPSVHALARHVGALPLPAVRHIGVQALERLRVMHERGLLHCDVKPANYLLPRVRRRTGADAAISDRSRADLALDLVGRLSEMEIAAVDFGFARALTNLDGRDRDLGQSPLELADRKRRGVLGSARFASIPNHRGGALG